MSFIGKLISKITGSEDQAQAAAKAGKQQAAAAQAGIDRIDALNKPYIEAGVGAIGSMEDLMGLNGPEAQAAALQAIQSSPQFASMTQQGENAILQNASATGGLRGGNTQAALAQFRPEMLSQLINQRYGQLGGLASIGQSAASGTGVNVANLMQQQGAALAGGTLAKGSLAQQGFGTLLNVGAILAGSGALNGLFGGAAGSVSGGSGLSVPTGFKF